MKHKLLATIGIIITMLAIFGVSNHLLAKPVSLTSNCIPTGWSVIGSGNGQWQCQGSTIVGHSTAGDSILASSTTYADVTLSATVSSSNREASLAIRLQDAGNGYIVIFLPDGISWNNGVGGIWIAKRTGYSEQYLGYYHGTNFPSLGQSAQLSVSAIGTSIEVELNNQTVLQVTDTTYTSGRVGFRIYGDATLPCDSTFANVTVSGGTIVNEARLDIGMPYNTNRGCSSPYIGCSGPYHGFYSGVCTDLAMDAYGTGVSFNIQDALYQDHLAHPGRYRYGTARNAEDMRRYFSYNQQLLPHSQSYQTGDIAFFDWNGDGMTDHVNIISDVDGSGRPLKMVDATGIYSGNPSGLAFEHSWFNYYDLHSQGHGQLNPASTATYNSIAETSNSLRISLTSSSLIVFTVLDANGKLRSADYDENLVASNVESFIPYIPGSNYVDTGTQQVITITHPLSNTTKYSVMLEGQVSETYNLLVETLDGFVITDSELFTESIGINETHRLEITLSDISGSIEFTATSPTASPLVDISDSLDFAGLVGTSAQLTFDISEMGGQYSINDIVITSTELSDQLGGMILASELAITPENFDIVANGVQEVTIQIDLSDISPGIYQGSLIISTQNGGLFRTQFLLNVEFHQIYLPVVTKN